MASVVVPTARVSLSYAVVVVHSALSMCSQKEKTYDEQPVGSVTDCDSVSVCVVP